jgi:signal transduction histidine kinase/CheY-like chemotaxis protein
MYGRLRDPVFIVISIGMALCSLLFWRDRAAEAERRQLFYERSARDRVAAGQRVLASDIEWMTAAARISALRPGPIDPQFLCDFANPTNDIGFIGSWDGPSAIRASDCRSRVPLSLDVQLSPMAERSGLAVFRGVVRRNSTLYSVFSVDTASGTLFFGLDGERLIERALSYLPSAGVHVGILAQAGGRREILAFHRSRLSKGYQLPAGWAGLPHVVTGDMGLAAGQFTVFCLPAGHVLEPPPATGVVDLTGSLVITGLLAVLLRRMRDQTRETNRLIEVRTRQLAEARDEALESSRLKSRFLATMSHEIRTPMNGVIGMAQLLAETRLSDEQRGMVEDLVASARSLLTLLNNLLDFSKIDAGKMTVFNVPMDLVEVTRSAVRTFSASARGKGVELRQTAVYQEAGGGTRALDRLVVQGDAIKINQVVVNLLSNAVKFTDRGAVDVRLDVRDVEAGKARVRLEVADSGPGIPAELWPRLFQPFNQADGSYARRHGGSGLGLAIARSLAQLLGGELLGENRAEGGARFWLELVLEKAALPDDPAAAPPVVSTSVAVKVLLVEDNLINQKVAMGLLKKLGYQVSSAISGAEAIRMLGEHEFHAVLMDCQMPEMDGFEATAIIRSMSAAVSKVPIIALTANGMPGDRERCLEAGMDDFLAKPVDLQRLREVLNKWVSPVEAANAASPGPLPPADVPSRVLA